MYDISHYIVHKFPFIVDNNASSNGLVIYRPQMPTIILAHGGEVNCLYRAPSDIHNPYKSSLGISIDVKGHIWEPGTKTSDVELVVTSVKDLSGQNEDDWEELGIISCKCNEMGRVSGGTLFPDFSVKNFANIRLYNRGMSFELSNISIHTYTL